MGAEHHYTRTSEVWRVEREVDLRRLGRVLWKRRLLIAILTIVAAVAAGAMTSRLYESQVLLRLSDQAAPAYASAQSVAIVTSGQPFLDGVARSIGLTESARTLRGRIRVEPIRDSQMIVLVRVRHPDPVRAEQLVRAVGRMVIARGAVRVEEKRKIVQAQLQSVTAEIREVHRLLEVTRRSLEALQEDQVPRSDPGFVHAFLLDAMSTGNSLHSELRARERELTLELLALDPPELLDAPSGPDLVAPRMTPLVSAAAVLGLLAGSALALLIDYLTVPPVGLPQPAPAVSRPSAPES